MLKLTKDQIKAIGIKKPYTLGEKCLVEGLGANKDEVVKVAESAIKRLEGYYAKTN